MEQGQGRDTQGWLGSCSGLRPQGGEDWDSVLAGGQLRSSDKSVGLDIKRPTFEPGPATYQLPVT